MHLETRLETQIYSARVAIGQLTFGAIIIICAAVYKISRFMNSGTTTTTTTTTETHTHTYIHTNITRICINIDFVLESHDDY